jgi:hypothetical protein
METARVGFMVVLVNEALLSEDVKGLGNTEEDEEEEWDELVVEDELVEVGGNAKEPDVVDVLWLGLMTDAGTRWSAGFSIWSESQSEVM